MCANDLSFSNESRVKVLVLSSCQKWAKKFGLSLDAVRNWEQGRREPDKAAQILLTMIAFDPEAVARAMARLNKTMP